MARIITGIEISAHRIQAVEISVQRKTTKILRYIDEDLDGDSLTSDTLALFASEYAIQKESVVASVPGDMLITRNVSVPFRERSRIDKVIYYELEPLVPFPIQELELCYRIIRQEKGKSDLLVYALPRNLLDSRSALFEEAGIPLRMITVSSLASANALLQTQKVQEQVSFLHLHVAANFSILSIYEKGVLNHLQRLTWGEAVFLGRIQEMTGLDIGTLSARLRAITPSEASELIEAMKEEPFEPTPQIRKILQAYLMRTQTSPPEALYVTGAVPGLYLLPPLVEADLSIRTEIPDPLSPFSHDLENNPGLYAMHAPLGMALMEGGRDALSSTFRKQKFSLISRMTESRQELRYAAFLVIFLILAGLFDFFVGIQAKEYTFSQLQNETNRIIQETFPEVKNVINPLEQMKLKIKEVEKQNDIFKSLFGEKPSPLDVLSELSARVPEEIELAIVDLTIDEKSIRFMGWTDSFNSVNKVEQELKKSDIFGTVSVSNAKVGKDKSRVNFQIKIAFKDS